MNKEIKELLKSVQPEVVKKEKIRETIRKENEEREIKNLYDKAVNTSGKMNLEIVKKIIDVYLKKRDDLIKERYLGYRYEGNVIINLYSITTLNNSYRYKDIKNMEECDQKAIELLDRINNNTPTELTKDIQEKALLWNDETSTKLAFLNTKAFDEQGIIFQSLSYNNPNENLTITTDYDTIEKFTYNALENKLENGLILSEEDIKQYKDMLKNLSKKEQAISTFRAKSEKNANIIALDIVKQLLTNYKKSPNLQLLYYLHTIKNCYYVFNNNIKNDAILSELDRTIIQEYLQYYPNSMKEPTIIALPYQSDEKEKYLYMQDLDLKNILDSIDIKYVIEDNTLKTRIQVVDLEFHVIQASDEEKENDNTK